MTEKVEELAILVESLKQENDVNAESFSKILGEIKDKIENIQAGDVVYSDMINELRQVVDNKISAYEDKINSVGETLQQMKTVIDTGLNDKSLVSAVENLADNFRSGFESVISFANRDTESKNSLFNRLSALEEAVIKGEMVESLKHRTDDLIKGYEDFVVDANLRHGNMVSAIADMRLLIDEYTFKTSQVCKSLENTLNHTNSQLSTLENTVSSNLNQVNTKLYAIGDDVQKKLNVGFDHLKYLSSNLVEHVNSNSIDVKTILECLRANVSEYSEYLKNELLTLKDSMSSQISESYNMQKVDSTNLSAEVAELEENLNKKAAELNELISEKVQTLGDFIAGFKDVVISLESENRGVVEESFNALETRIESNVLEYKNLLGQASEEVKAVSAEISKLVEACADKTESDILDKMSAEFVGLTSKVENIVSVLDDYRQVTAENLTGYLSSIKTLFQDFTDKFESTQNQEELFSKLSVLEDLMNSFNAEKNENFDFLKSAIADCKTTLDEINTKNIQADEVCSKSFAEVKGMLEERASNESEIKVLMESFRENIQGFAEQLSHLGMESTQSLDAIKYLVETESNKNEIIEKISELFSTSLNGDFVDRLESLINVKTELLEAAQDDTRQLINSNFVNVISEIKETLDNNSKKVEDISIASISTNERVAEYKVLFEDKFEDIKESISEISDNVRLLFSETANSELLDRFEGLESKFVEESHSYESSLKGVADSLELFKEVIFASNSTVGDNLKVYLDEFTKIQGNFDKISEQISTQIGNSGLIEILANIRQQFNVLESEMKEENKTTSEEIKNDLALVAQNLEEVKAQLGADKGDNGEQFEEFLSEIKSELSSLSEKFNADNSESFAPAFDNYEVLRNSLESFISNGYENNLAKLKEQIELSFASLIAEVPEKLKESDFISNIEEACLKSVTKLGEFEAVVKDMTETTFNNISNNLLNLDDIVRRNFDLTESFQESLQADFIRLETKLMDNNAVNKSLSETLEEFKQLINQKKSVGSDEIRDAVLPLLDNEDLADLLRGLNKSLYTKLEEIQDVQSLADTDILNLLNEISKVVENAQDVIDSKFSSVQENQTALVEKVDEINSKLDILTLTTDNKSLVVAIEALKNTVLDFTRNENEFTQKFNEKIDKLSTDNSDEVLDEIKELFENQKGINNSDTLTSICKEINLKLDVIADAEENSVNEDVLEKLDLALADLRTLIQDRKAYAELLGVLDNKIDILVQSEDDILNNAVEEIKGLILGLSNYSPDSGFLDMLNAINAKLDVLASSEVSDLFPDYETKLDDLKAESSDIKNKLDDLNGMSSEVKNILDDMNSASSEVKNSLDDLRDESSDMKIKLDELKGESFDIKNQLVEIKSDTEISAKIENLVNTLNNKVDIIAMSDTSDMPGEIAEIRDLVEEQLYLFKASNEDLSVEEALSRLLEELNKISNGLNNIDFSGSATDIKDAIISAVVNLTDTISFVEETEEIKDFVSEKTSEIHRALMDVRTQLSSISNNSDGLDAYTYSLQDIESDFVKLRLAINDLSAKSVDSEIGVISANLNKMTKNLDELAQAVVEVEAKRSGDEMQEQLVSISSRINQLLLTKRDIDEFVIGKLEANNAAISRLEKSSVFKSIEKILVSMDGKLTYSNNLNNILKNVMMYLGEWMDGTTETLSGIYSKSSKVVTISDAIADLKESMPEQKVLLDFVEEKFNHQEARLENLEKQLDRMNSLLAAKTDDLDKKLTYLGENIEKLASYVE